MSELNLGSPEPTKPDALCDQCQKPFAPRSGNGGKSQRFCSPTCRQDFHGQRSQRGTSPVGDEDPPAKEAPTEKSPSLAPQKASTGVLYEADDYTWDDEDVVLRRQPKTAIYWNVDGNLVIRQQGYDDDDDPYVVICKNNLQEFIDRLCDLAGIFGAGRR